MKIIFVIVVVCVVMFLMFRGNILQSGGSRSAIFSRFNYQPDFPFISQLDTVDLDRFSKVYNVADPMKFIVGRPHRFYHTPDSTWVYPWTFPQPVYYQKLKETSQRCNEPPVVIFKKGEDKLKGLAIETPKDIVHVSPCFEATYRGNTA